MKIWSFRVAVALAPCPQCGSRTEACEDCRRDIAVVVRRLIADGVKVHTIEAVYTAMRGVRMERQEGLFA